MRNTDSPSFRTAGLLVLLALALHAVSLGWGFNYDDHIHQYLMRYAMDWPGAAPWRLYDFSFWTQAASSQHANLAPWWTSPDFKVSFFRPISSLVLWADYRLYDGWAVGYHLTSLAVFAMLLILVFRLYVELGAPRRAALWGLAFFALKDIHVLPVCWIANRNELLSSFFVVAMMINVVRHDRLGGLHRLAAGVACFLCACMSKESGLIGLPLVGLYLFILGGRTATETFFSRCVRVLRSPVMWVFFLVGVLYLVEYVANGHGSMSSNYATPWHRTGVYIGRVASLFPLASGSLFFGLSTDLIFTRPQLYVPVLAISTVLFLVLAWIFWRWLRENPVAWFAVGWGAAALFPMAGVTLSDRLLMSACVGSSLILGLLLDQLGTLREVFTNVRSRWPALVFITTGFIISFPTTVLRQQMFHKMAETDRAAILSSDIRRAGEPPQTAIVLNSPSTLLAITLPPTWAVGRDDPATAIYALQVARRGTDFLRDSENSLVMTFENPALLTHRYERVFHTREEPPPPGTEFTTPAFTATILATVDQAVHSVRLDFPVALEKSGCIFLEWGNGAYQRVDPPAIGQHLKLPAPAPTVRWAP